MITAWRLVKAKHRSRAFDGEGARLYGGRWNSPGIRIIYTSGSKSLAALETLVHLDVETLPNFVLFSIRFKESLVLRLNPAQLKRGWNSEPPTAISQQIGDNWYHDKESPVLAVPSAITGEINYLLNPDHISFSKLEISPPEAFTLDHRLL